MKKILTVEGMSCEHCVAAVKRVLGELDGVKNVEVDLINKRVEIEGDDVSNDKIREVISDVGYEVLEIKE